MRATIRMTAPGITPTMRTLVIGVTVRGAASTSATASESTGASPRKLTLVMQHAPGRHGEAPVAGFTLSEASPDATLDPSTDHVIVLGRSGLMSEEPSLLTDPESVVMNGERAPRLVWKAGQRHRLRLINITPDDIFTVTLQTSDGPVMWKPVAKDGVPLPIGESITGPARQIIAVGESYEFEYQAPEGRRSAWLEVRTPGGKWQVQGQVLIR